MVDDELLAEEIYLEVGLGVDALDFLVAGGELGDLEVLHF